MHRFIYTFLAAMLTLTGLPVEGQGRWSTINFVDEFGDVTDTGAVSPKAKPIRPMSFPYHDVTARIFVDCQRTWIRFTEVPNLIGGDTKDGFTTYKVPIRIDGNRKELSVSQTWGDKDLGFRFNTSLATSLSSGSTIAVSLPWYGQGNVAFRWNLNGSAKAIESSCDGSDDRKPIVTKHAVVTIEQYQSIRKGMSHGEVKDLLGGYTGVLIKEDDTGKTYKWRNLDGSGMNATFDEYDMLVEKVQIRLE